METIPECRERSLKSLVPFLCLNQSHAIPCHVYAMVQRRSATQRLFIYPFSGMFVCDIISISPLHLSQCEKQVLILRLHAQLRPCIVCLAGLLNANASHPRFEVLIAFRVQMTNALQLERLKSIVH